MTSSNSSQSPKSHKDFDKLMADYQQVHQGLSEEIQRSASRNKRMPLMIWFSILGLVLVTALVATWVFRLNDARPLDKALGVSLLPQHAWQAQIPPIKTIDTTRAINNQVVQQTTFTQTTTNTQQPTSLPQQRPVKLQAPAPLSPTKTDSSNKAPAVSSGLSKFESATPVAGMAALYQYLQQALRYPAQAREKKISGKVWVRFQVNTAGKIQNAKVIKGLGYGCDQEAIRIVENMPLWHPATVNGKPVTTALKIPIVFDYQDAMKKEEKNKN